MIRIAPRKAPPPLLRRGPPTLAARPLATRASAVPDACPDATQGRARLSLLMAGEAA